MDFKNNTVEEINDIQKKLENGPFFKTIGFEFADFKEGEVIIKLKLNNNLLNTEGFLHGGVIATMLDNIIGMTMKTLTKQPLVTINLDIQYIKSINEGNVYARANILKKSGRILVGEGELFDEKKSVLAKGIGSWKVM